MNPKAIMKAALLAAAVLCLGNSLPAQAGGEIGKGNWTKKILEKSRYAPIPGGRPLTDFEDLYAYCDSAYRILTRYKSMAYGPFRKGDLVSARHTLLEGLIEAELAFQRDPAGFSPFTRVAVSRGIFLDQAFTGGCRNDLDPQSLQSCLQRENQVAVAFLSKYYTYVLETVITLDREYYLPFRQRHHHRCQMSDGGLSHHSCMDEDWGMSFYYSMARSAKSLLDLYLGRNTYGDAYTLPNGFGKDKYELKALWVVLTGAAEDLNSDPVWRRQFGCLVLDLQNVAGYINEFLSGSEHSMFVDSRDAVRNGRAAAEHASDLLGITEPNRQGRGQRCMPPHWPDHGRD